MRISIVLMLTVTVSIFPVPTRCNTSTYDNERELMGGAYMSLITKGELVSKTLAFCSTENKSFRSQAKATSNKWKSRNSRYLVLAPILLAEMRKISEAEGRSEKWREHEMVLFPSQRELLSGVLVDQLKLTPPAQRMEMCKDFANAIDAGKIDFAADPALIVYLDKRLTELSK